MELNVTYGKEIQKHYPVETDRDIKEQVQKVTIKTIKINDCELDQFKKVMNFYFMKDSTKYGPLWTYIMVVPGRYFYINYAKDSENNFVKLPVQWLDMRRGDRCFIRSFQRDLIYTLEKVNAYSNSLSCRTLSQCMPDVCFSDQSIKSTCSLPLDTCDDYPTVVEDNPSS